MLVISLPSEFIVAVNSDKVSLPFLSLSSELNRSNKSTVVIEVNTGSVCAQRNIQNSIMYCSCLHNVASLVKAKVPGSEESCKAVANLPKSRYSWLPAAYRRKMSGKSF